MRFVGVWVFFNVSWGAADYAWTSVLFWWWRCTMVRKRSKRKEITTIHLRDLWLSQEEIYLKSYTVKAQMVMDAAKDSSQATGIGHLKTGFSAVSPALCMHLQLPHSWVFHVPTRRKISVMSCLKWKVATFGYTLNHNRLFCTVAADIAPWYGRGADPAIGSGPDSSSTPSCFTCCSLASPAAPAPRNSGSVGSISASLAKKA